MAKKSIGCSVQKIVDFPVNRNRKIFREPTYLQLEILTVCKYPHLQKRSGNSMHEMNNICRFLKKILFFSSFNFLYFMPLQFKECVFFSKPECDINTFFVVKLIIKQIFINAMTNTLNKNTIHETKIFVKKKLFL